MVEHKFPPYHSHLVQRVSMADWLAKAHPDAPALPWTSDDGIEVCSFVIVPLEFTGGLMAVLLDAHGNEVVQSTAVDAILATCLALNPVPRELTFLPAAVNPQR